MDFKFDNKTVFRIKRLLQYALPIKIRKIICDELFKKYVTSDEKSFSKQLYMNLSQLTEMYKLGHEIGLHCYNHVWLERLSQKDQVTEIVKKMSIFVFHKSFIYLLLAISHYFCI